MSRLKRSRCIWIFKIFSRIMAASVTDFPYISLTHRNIVNCRFGKRFNSFCACTVLAVVIVQDPLKVSVNARHVGFLSNTLVNDCLCRTRLGWFPNLLSVASEFSSLNWCIFSFQTYFCIVLICFIPIGKYWSNSTILDWIVIEIMEIACVRWRRNRKVEHLIT